MNVRHQGGNEETNLYCNEQIEQSPGHSSTHSPVISVSSKHTFESKGDSSINSAHNRDVSLGKLQWYIYMYGYIICYCYLVIT